MADNVGSKGKLFPGRPRQWCVGLEFCSPPKSGEETRDLLSKKSR